MSDVALAAHLSRENGETPSPREERGLIFAFLGTDVAGHKANHIQQGVRRLQTVQ